MSFGIGLDEANKIDVVLVQMNFPFVARICRGTRKSEGAVPTPEKTVLEGDPHLFWGRSPNPPGCAARV